MKKGLKGLLKFGVRFYLVYFLVLNLISCMGGAAAPAYVDRFENNSPEENALTTSLFSSDTSVIDNKSAQILLSSKIILAKENKIILLQIPSRKTTSRYYGYYYWKNEENLDLESRYTETLTKHILTNKRVYDVSVLPSFIKPEKITISNLREAALRMQGNLILVYKVESDIFIKSRWFKPNEVKAYCTVEAFLLDSRTGLIPFSTVVTKKHSIIHDSDDTIDETERKAEVECTIQSLDALSKEVDAFLKGVEKN